MREIARRVQRAFRERFGVAPIHLIRAPGRVNLIGDHTDYSGGLVMPLALEHAIWIALRPRADHRVVLHSLDFAETAELNLTEPQTQGKGWQEYFKGVAWVLREAGWPLSGWEGVFAGDVPRGAGLSSSAALEMACIRAFAEASGVPWEPQVAAKLAQRAENEWVGMNCGIMDQLISGCGVAGHALFIDCRSFETVPVPLPEGTKVLVLDTRTRRGLVDSAYNERRASCEEVARRLGHSLLRDVRFEELESQTESLGSQLVKRARHVLTENQRVRQAVEAMCSNNPDELGRLMQDSHASLRDDFEVSSPALDAMVACALAAPGCFGARMTGAGFGGSAVALIDAGIEARFTEAVGSSYCEVTGVDPEIMTCAPTDGVNRLNRLTEQSVYADI
ncbi:MAG TPA: galactokinase [Deltaproteobacteria bacterium]|nr:galactokinase [Deltaproteobacteria bacterium]